MSICRGLGKKNIEQENLVYENNLDQDLTIIFSLKNYKISLIFIKLF